MYRHERRGRRRPCAQPAPAGWVKAHLDASTNDPPEHVTTAPASRHTPTRATLSVHRFADVGEGRRTGRAYRATVTLGTSPERSEWVARAIPERRQHPGPVTAWADAARRRVRARTGGCRPARPGGGGDGPVAPGRPHPDGRATCSPPSVGRAPATASAAPPPRPRCTGPCPCACPTHRPACPGTPPSPTPRPPLPPTRPARTRR